MNIRNYLKGIGVGIIVASLVLIIAGKFNNKAMSDDDVIKRAKELGMVESTTLTSPSANNGLTGKDDNVRINEDADKNSSDTDKNSNDTDKAVEGTDQPETGVDVNADNTNTADDDKSTTEADKEKNADDQNQASEDKSVTGTDSDRTSNTDKNVKSSETVSVEVKSGMSSESAATAAKDAGLVDDDIEFNKYLCANGYDKRLRVGQYDIPKGSDFETIAKYLCGEQ